MLRSASVIEAFYSAFNEGRIDDAVEHLHEQFEWRPAFGRGLIGGNSYVGREGFRRYWQDLRESFSRYRVEPRETDELGKGRVLLMVRVVATGRGSGVEVDRTFAILYQLDEDGLIRSGETYDDRLAALSGMS
jgi:ketosteroid isomerase-like protein